jgi:hypothetical protein
MCQYNFAHLQRLPTPRAIGRRETTAECDLARTREVMRTPRSLGADYEFLAPESVATVSAEAWDEVLDLAKTSGSAWA